MKKLEKPRSGGVVPIFYKGTLKQKYAELLKVQERIEEISSHRDTSPSKAILDDRGELELEIDRHLINGEQLEDKFMDFCLRHFNGGTTSNINGIDVRRPSVFDAIPGVKEFLEYVKEHTGQKILSAHDSLPSELGMIDREGQFEVSEGYRHLYVPTKQLFAFDSSKNSWERGRPLYDGKKDDTVVENTLFYVHPDLLSPKLGQRLLHLGIWETRYPKEGYIGGGPPEDVSIYVGDEPVQTSLRNVGEITKTRTKTEEVASAPI